MESDRIYPYATFSYARFPLVEIKLTGVDATPELFESYLDEVGSLYKKGRYAILLDISNKDIYLEKKYQKMQANALYKNKNIILQHAIGLAIIAPSIVQRVILQGIFVINPYPRPYKISRDKEKAQVWIKQLISQDKK